MALKKEDVLATLGDPIVAGMNFWLGPVNISGRHYATIRDHVLAGNILVVEGTGDLAWYNHQTDILTTQKGTSPANLDQRALLLHECTHALIDVFTGGLKVTRHIDELASYIVQLTYSMRSNPARTRGSGTDAWSVFFRNIDGLITTHDLHRMAGNGKRVDLTALEPLRLQLVALPGVPYGSWDKSLLVGADGLSRKNPFLDNESGSYTTTETEPYPDPGDDYLARTLLEKYAASDVAGFGKRLRTLRRDFAKCSVARARELGHRLALRRPNDRVSELFHDRLSREGRAILLAVLKAR